MYRNLKKTHLFSTLESKADTAVFYPTKGYISEKKSHDTGVPRRTQAKIKHVYLAFVQTFPFDSLFGPFSVWLLERIVRLVKHSFRCFNAANLFTISLEAKIELQHERTNKHGGKD